MAGVMVIAELVLPSASVTLWSAAAIGICWSEAVDFQALGVNAVLYSLMYLAPHIRAVVRRYRGMCSSGRDLATPIPYSPR